MPCYVFAQSMGVLCNCCGIILPSLVEHTLNSYPPRPFQYSDALIEVALVSSTFLALIQGQGDISNSYFFFNKECSEAPGCVSRINGQSAYFYKKLACLLSNSQQCFWLLAIVICLDCAMPRGFSCESGPHCARYCRDTTKRSLSYSKANLRWVWEKNFPESKVPRPTSNQFTVLQDLVLSFVFSSILFTQNR